MKEYLIAATYWCQVKVDICDRTAAVTVSQEYYLCTDAIFPAISGGLTLYGHIKTAEQQTIIQQYTGRWWVGCYIWYSEEGPGRDGSPPSPLLAVPNVTAHPSSELPVYQIHIIIASGLQRVNRYVPYTPCMVTPNMWPTSLAQLASSTD